MNEVLLEKVNNLKSELDKHPDVIELEKIEKEMENNTNSNDDNTG